jgi:polysaccharide biosynthesis protein PslH
MESIICGTVRVPLEMGERERFPSEPGRHSRWMRFGADYIKNSTPYSFRFRTPKFRHLLARHVSGYDAVFCRYLCMLPAVLDFPRERIVVDADDLYYLGLLRSARLTIGRDWHSLMLAAEAGRSYRFEQRSFHSVARVLVCSENDADRVRCPRKSVIKNGVDLPDSTETSELPVPNTIVFVGSMSYGPNVEALKWFVAHVWPSLRALVPDVRLNVVGREGTADLTPFARIPGIALVGEVTDTTPWVRSAMLSIAPLRFGLGTRIKILESLACGRAVVSTRIGADGLGDLDERTGLFRVDHPIRTAQRIGSLLADPSHTLAVGREGRALIEKRYTWDFTTRELASDMDRWIAQGSPVFPRAAVQPAKL